MSEFHRTSKWASFTKYARPRIAAALPLPCVNAFVGEGCRGVVYPGERFDVAHIRSHHLDPTAPLSLEMVGPAHPRCNRKAGAKEGRAKQLRAKSDAEGKNLPRPGSGW